jgi:hypothetical protein
MTISGLAHVLRRAIRLRRLFEREASRPHSSPLRLLRLKILQWRVRSRLEAIFAPPARPVPAGAPARRRGHSGR